MVDNTLWRIFPSCDCVKHILYKSGFESPNYLRNITDAQLNQLENFINEDGTIFNNLNIDCPHIGIYLNQQNFKFLPGHRFHILNWSENCKDNSVSNENIAIEHPAFSPILREMIRTALLNYEKLPTNNRFPELLMNFSIYLYIMAGRACYEIISANLPLPKAGTVHIHIHNDKDRVIEGELRCKQLADYLERMNSPKCVFLSEDGSGVVQKIAYDVHSNQLVGLVLPFNDANGMPKMFSFEAKSAEDIEKYMQLPQSSLVYIVAAQPLKIGAPPFILQIFGTNNTFETHNVLSRWAHTESELKKHGIEVIGVSSDGDSRLLNAMKNRMKFGLTPDIDLKTFAEGFLICTQDTVHEGTKMRNRLLNSSIVLYMGNEIVSVVHIKMLLEKSSKEVHGLVHSDILPEDRQNYASIEKIMEPRVIKALEECVVDSRGTRMYIKLCKQITSSFLEEGLHPIERIYRIWHALYFLRCWRKWVKSDENNHTLSDNFISTNLFLCVEINAHALVYLMVRMRNQQSLFLPKLFASQPCESIFRQMRSMGTMNYTKINFTLNELLHMIARVELMNKIIFLNKEIIFPRFQLKLGTVANVNLPADEDILNAMKRARRDALENAAKFDMRFCESDITEFDSSLFKEVKKKTKENLNLSSSNQSLDESFNVNVLEQVDESRNENISFIQVTNADGTTTNVRKSTFVWKLLQDKGKLSSDRLKRVQGSSTSFEPKRKKQKKQHSLPYEEQLLFKFAELEVGDWALFKANDEIQDSFNEQNVNQFLINNCLIGVVLGFKSIGEKGQSVQYKLSYAPTLLNEKYKTNLQVLGSWYNCDQNGVLTPLQNKNKTTIRMKSYIATMKTAITTKHENFPDLLYKIPCEYLELSKSLLELISQT